MVRELSLSLKALRCCIRIPLGVEYFPFENVPISATVEGSPYFFFEEENNCLSPFFTVGDYLLFWSVVRYK